MRIRRDEAARVDFGSGYDSAKRENNRRVCNELELSSRAAPSAAGPRTTQFAGEHFARSRRTSSTRFRSDRLTARHHHALSRNLRAQSVPPPALTPPRRTRRQRPFLESKKEAPMPARPRSMPIFFEFETKVSWSGLRGLCLNLWRD